MYLEFCNFSKWNTGNVLDFCCWLPVNHATFLARLQTVDPRINSVIASFLYALARSASRRSSQNADSAECRPWRLSTSFFLFFVEILILRTRTLTSKTEYFCYYFDLHSHFVVDTSYMVFIMYPNIVILEYRYLTSLVTCTLRYYSVTLFTWDSLLT